MQQTYGIVALDITPDAPYVTKAWENFDKSAPFATTDLHQLDCTLAPNQLPTFPGFPPSEYKNKLMSTYRRCKITANIVIILLKIWLEIQE